MALAACGLATFEGGAMASSGDARCGTVRGAMAASQLGKERDPRQG